MMLKKNQSRGRPIIGDQLRKRYNITLDPTIKEEAAIAAKQDGKSFSMWIETAIKEKIERDHLDASKR